MERKSNIPHLVSASQSLFGDKTFSRLQKGEFQFVHRKCNIRFVTQELCRSGLVV